MSNDLPVAVACFEEPFDWVIGMDDVLLWPHYRTGIAAKVFVMVVDYKYRDHFARRFVRYRPTNSQVVKSVVHNRLPHPSLYSILQKSYYKRLYIKL